jgi:hypothetical protein
MSTTLHDPEREQAAHSVALFAVLVDSWQTNDFREAARACDELERLGVAVRMPPRRWLPVQSPSALKAAQMGRKGHENA